MAAASVPLFAGTTCLLGELRWFRQCRLVDRLRPYATPARGASSGGWSASPGPTLATWATRLGDRLSRSLGLARDLPARLAQLDARVDVSTFRLRQLGWAAAAMAAATVVVSWLHVPALLAFVAVSVSPCGAYAATEFQLHRALQARRQSVLLELPVVSEQLGMLVSAGYSLSSALRRVAERGRGRCARDIGRVCTRVQQGLSEEQALREWAVTSGVDAVRRLVTVLALNREASDLGRLVSEEARNIRREVQRSHVAAIERRAQQVWVPVTLATLVPGIVFLAVPFIDALRLYSNA